jgi:parallel beta-helix repeat protein
MTSYGIYNTGAYSIDGTISGNTFFDCVYGIVLENPQGWTISVNNFEMCSTACISISGSGYIIDRNVFDDIKTTGINVVNSGTRGSVISCNTITAMSHDSVTGILITSSAAGHINVTGNTLYCNKEGILTDTNDTDGLTYCKGVKTVNSGAALPGDIIDNIIVDFATPYTIADSTTIVRYIDYDTNRNTPTLKTTPDRIDGTTLSVVSSGSRPEGNIIAGRGSICFYNATDNVARQVYIKTTAKSSSPIICAYGSSVISGASIFGATLNNTASGLLWYTYNNNTFNLYKSKGTAEGDLVATATYSGNTTLALKKKTRLRYYRNSHACIGFCSYRFQPDHYAAYA